MVGSDAVLLARRYPLDRDAVRVYADLYVIVPEKEKITRIYENLKKHHRAITKRKYGQAKADLLDYSGVQPIHSEIVDALNNEVNSAKDATQRFWVDLLPEDIDENGALMSNGIEKQLEQIQVKFDIAIAELDLIYDEIDEILLQ
ncbi:MAG: hypothetical protein COY80_03385 [Candidatus Pacebacteria bacterium CG_4_10_14_0_8_um_filter_42_14]|nr:MAG: hypothetical protein COY80_03385 [Candidatus Pacebacteria bacterium CG_4_10_14_0_8_um_filter_42_14]